MFCQSYWILGLGHTLYLTYHLDQILRSAKSSCSETWHLNRNLARTHLLLQFLTGGLQRKNSVSLREKPLKISPEIYLTSGPD